MKCPACGGNLVVGQNCKLCDMFRSGRVPSCPHSAGWPIHSNAAGVDPSQVPEAMEAAKKRGVPTRFDERGRPIFTGPLHRKEYCEKVRGFYDMDGGYLDPTPQGIDYQGGVTKDPGGMEASHGA